VTLSTIFCFIGASAALTIAPGPDNIFVVTQGIARGRKPAIITALGMCSGISVHTAAAALGISALFHSSAMAFNIVKFSGAAYLVFLAMRTIREKSSTGFSIPDESGLAKLFRRGFLMNVLNPKVALFFLAFLPQFVTPATGSVPAQMMFLGFLFMIQATVIFSLIGYFSGSLGNWIVTQPKAAKCFNWITAGVLFSLGIKIALSEK